MIQESNVGAEHEVVKTVSPDVTAKAVGSGDLDVFATPMMIAMMEEAAAGAVAGFLDDDESTVGTAIDVKHTAATPVGMEVRAAAKLVSVDGRKLHFEIEAFDESGKIGEGEHDRFIIRKTSFMEKANGKLKR